MYNDSSRTQCKASKAASSSDVPCEDVPLPCEDMPHRRPKRKAKFILHDCSESCLHEAGRHEDKPAAEPGDREAPASGIVSARPNLGPVRRDFLGSDLVMVNERSRTVHKVWVQFKKGVDVKCSWIPPYGSVALKLEQLTGEDLYTCGTCCGSRRLLLLDDD